MLPKRAHKFGLFFTMAIVSLELFADENKPKTPQSVSSYRLDAVDDNAAKKISYNQQGFMIDGKYKILLGGSLQWFRIPECEWEDRIRKFKAAGFNTIDMYVPWNLIEPKEGLFNFKKPNIEHFLQLAKQNDLWVYIRPGPYITNEMDGGGLPAWLFKKSSKRSTEEDGFVNLRTCDPDYLNAVRRYFRELNHVIAPYQITRGGPIILYSIENEYDWFDGFFQIDKLFIHKGQRERVFKQDKGSRDYFTALKQFILSQDIDIPITTCPGNAEVAHMGDVKDIIPMPNIYNPPDAILNSLGNYTGPLMPEKIASDVVQSMHDPERFGGIYNQMPSGTSETYRSSSTMNRLILGGMKAFFGFNMFGFYTPGYYNSLTFSNKKSDHIRFKIKNLSSLFLKPSVGYFHNVIDFYGAVGPSGSPREKFYNFRRANLLIQSFEGEFGKLGLPKKISTGADGSDVIQVKHPLVGAEELKLKNRQVYWHRLAPERFLIGLVNETLDDIILPRESINIDGLVIPKFTNMTLPLESYPGARDHKGELEHTHMMMTSVDLGHNINLRYTTSEILSNSLLEQFSLLVIYGVKETLGEMVIQKPENVSIAYIDSKIKIESLQKNEIAFSYQHLDDQMMTLQSPNGEKTYILVTSREKAGRTWTITRGDGSPYLVSGVDLATPGIQAGQWELKIDQGRHKPDILVLGNPLPDLPNFIKVLETDISGLTKALFHPIQQNSNEDLVLSRNAMTLDRGMIISESSLHDKQVFKSIETQNPIAMEKLDIYHGTAWYQTTFNLSSEELGRMREELDTDIYVEHASDIISIYLNNHYLSTVCPVGNSIHTKDLTPNELVGHLLREGENSIVFKTEIWGHGSFMWPRGRLSFTNFSIPSLGYDSLKGLWGEARIGDISLSKWSFSSQRLGDVFGFTRPRELSHWNKAKFPERISPGDTSWWTQTITRGDLAHLKSLDAPQVLALKGRNLKASIYFEGELLGRWISDNTWLRRGTWLNSIRNPWMELSPDHFPLPIQTALNEKQSVTISITFEDTSGQGEESGQIDDISLMLNQENKQYISGSSETTGKVYENFSI